MIMIIRCSLLNPKTSMSFLQISEHRNSENACAFVGKLFLFKFQGFQGTLSSDTDFPNIFLCRGEQRDSCEVMWLVEKSLEALGSCGLDGASARKSRGPGVGEHEALARVFSVEKPRGPGVGEHEVDLCELWFGCSQCARLGAH